MAMWVRLPTRISLKSRPIGQELASFEGEAAVFRSECPLRILSTHQVLPVCQQLLLLRVEDGFVDGRFHNSTKQVDLRVSKLAARQRVAVGFSNASPLLQDHATSISPFARL